MFISGMLQACASHLHQAEASGNHKIDTVVAAIAQARAWARGSRAIDRAGTTATYAVTAKEDEGSMLCSADMDTVEEGETLWHVHWDGIDAECFCVGEVCFRCGKAGHYVRECPQNRRINMPGESNLSGVASADRAHGFSPCGRGAGSGGWGAGRRRGGGQWGRGRGGGKGAAQGF